MEEFSVLGTKLKLTKHQNKKYVIKETNINKHLQPHFKLITQLLHKYIKQMMLAGIPLPKIKESYVKKQKIVFVCEYKGLNIVQYMHHKSKKDFLKDKKIFNRIFEIIKLAQDSRIYFDPHIKNFVVSKNKIYYVDFSPPYCQEYFKIRLSNSKGSTKKILTENFKYFGPKLLGYHFAGDLLKLDSRYLEIMPKLYVLLKEKEIIDADYGKFLKKANEIKEIELTRDKKRIYLI